MLNKDQLIEAYQQLTGCCNTVWNWKLTDRLSLISTDCPNEQLFLKLLTGDGRAQAILEHMDSDIRTMPMICTISPMLSWLLAFDTDGEHTTVYVKGPFFSGYNDEQCYKLYFAPLSLTRAEEESLTASLQKIPTLAMGTVMDLARMLHYCLYRQSIRLNEITSHVSYPPRKGAASRVSTDQFKKDSGRWLFERELLEKVRQGDENIGNLLARNSMTPTAMRLTGGHALEDYRLNIHLVLTLISRAAVEGGLPQKTSFSLCGEYRRKLSKCTSMSEITLLGNDMIADYVHRVHKAKLAAGCAPQIRLCCEYIDTHPEEKLTLEELAAKTGYAPTHLSRKFKQETGSSIVDYIQRSKLERAKFLLTNTQQTVDAISDQLGFSSRSYLTNVFKKYTGETPTSYRKKNGVV